MIQTTPRRVAVIAAHPDDEVLGFGGAIARYADQGAEVRILILATGLASRGAAPTHALQALQDQGRRAAEIMKAGIEFADFPDNRMDSVALLDVVQRVEAFLDAFPADHVLTHHAGDLNVDHRIAQAAVLTACRPLPGATTRVLLAGEVNSATEWAGPGAQPFLPTEFIDIGAVLERKVAAMACYQQELRQWPHPRSLDGIRALAKWRGSQAGCHAAEAFITLRRLG